MSLEARNIRLGNRRNEGKIDTPGIHDHSENTPGIHDHSGEYLGYTWPLGDYFKKCFIFIDMVLILGMFHLSDSSALNRHQKWCL